jgi:hypothetical protein
MRSILWIVVSIIILIVAWPLFLFLIVLAIGMLLFAPKRVMVFRPQSNPRTQSQPHNDQIIDVEADVTILEEVDRE